MYSTYKNDRKRKKMNRGNLRFLNNKVVDLRDKVFWIFNHLDSDLMDIELYIDRAYKGEPVARVLKMEVEK